MLETSTTHLDRLITTGMLARQLAFDQGATGPVERASGVDRDLRRDQPYGAYPELPLRVALRRGSDAHARQQVRIDEIGHSIATHPHVSGRAAGRPDASLDVWRPPVPRGSAGRSRRAGRSTTPCTSMAQVRLARVKIKSPSFSNWRVFPFTVHDSNMMDYAINEASFGLTHGRLRPLGGSSRCRSGLCMA